jgi:hypothetical protein
MPQQGLLFKQMYFNDAENGQHWIITTLHSNFMWQARHLM